MKTINVNLYNFAELSADAKSNAISWYREQYNAYTWAKDALQSMEDFCKWIGTELLSYNIVPYSVAEYKVDQTSLVYACNEFTAERLSIPPDNNGYTLSLDLWTKFCETYELTHDALKAFRSAMNLACHNIRSDMEYEDTDEFISEVLTDMEYDFTEQGKRFII